MLEEFFKGKPLQKEYKTMKEIKVKNEPKVVKCS
jgi:hypothetical protein